MSEVWSLLQVEMIQRALLTALVVAVICSYLSVFVVLKRIVFVGAALSELASLGGALAFTGPVIWVFGTLFRLVPALEPLDHFRPLILALVTMLCAVVLFSQHALSRRIPREAMIGTAFAGAIGLTLLVLSRVQSSGQHELDVLKGSIIGVETQEMVELIITAVLVGIIQLLFQKEFVLVSFDPEVAATLGYKSPRWELLWYLSLGLMIAVSVHVAGTLLMLAYLVIPGVSALLVSRRLRTVFLLSVTFGVLATLVGVFCSLMFDIATSYVIVGCQVALFVACWISRSLTGLRKAG